MYLEEEVYLKHLCARIGPILSKYAEYHLHPIYKNEGNRFYVDIDVDYPEGGTHQMFLEETVESLPPLVDRLHPTRVTFQKLKVNMPRTYWERGEGEKLVDDLRNGPVAKLA